MRAITYSYDTPTLKLFSEPVAWRIAYLLADEIIAACVPATNMFFTECLQKVTDTKQKLNLMNGYFRNELSYMNEQIEELLANYKDMKKMKHKSKDFVVLSRRLDLLVGQFYKIYLLGMENEFERIGSTGLKEVLDADTFGFFELNSNNAESQSNDCLAASDILMSIGKAGGDEQEIFILTSEFFTYDDQQNLYDAVDEEAEVETNGYLHKCFEMPFIQALSPQELRLVRKELKGTLQPFRKAIDAWINYAVANTPGSLYHFRENVLKIAEGVTEAVGGHPMLAEMKYLYDEKLVTEVWLGELPINRIWDYYKKTNSITPATWRILESAKEKDTTYTRRFPVIVLKDKLDNNVSLPETAESLTTKKSILID